jgi:hypothetical protein
VAYGDIGRASEAMMGKASAQFASSAFMVSTLGSFIGCLVGPLSIGASPGRFRRPILLSSNFGGAFGAIIGTVAAFATEWIAEQCAPGRCSGCGWLSACLCRSACSGDGSARGPFSGSGLRPAVLEGRPSNMAMQRTPLAAGR